VTEQEQRARIIAVAHTWFPTPFVDQQGLKGVGVDCAYLLARVAEESGIIDHVEIPYYSPQCYLHKKPDGTWDHTYEQIILQYAHEITEDQVKPGDFVLYKQSHSYTHGGIIIQWPESIIHPIRPHGVIYSDAREGFLRGRKHRFFSVFPRSC
jgi:cell wall-associated NlpC family hydrolase